MGKQRSSGSDARFAIGPDGQGDADERRQRNGREVARQDIRCADADRDLPEMKERVTAQPNGGGAPQYQSHVRLRGTDEESPAKEDEDEADIAHEVLVEWPGIGHPGYSQVPGLWLNEHEDAVPYPQNAHKDGECENDRPHFTPPFGSGGSR